MKPYYADDAVTLYHGDCREVLLDLEREIASVCVADPPYGETTLAWDRWPTGWLAAVGDALAERGSLWCFGRPRVFMAHLAEFEGWSYSQEVIWRKRNGSGAADGRFLRIHENVWHWYRGPWNTVVNNVPREPVYTTDKSTRRPASATVHRRPDRATRYVDDGTRVLRSVLDFPSIRHEGRNETEKPVGLIAALIETSSPPDGLVIDPTTGSGTTLLAARLTGRRAIGVEIREEQCEIAAKRLSQEVLDFGAAS